MKLVNNNKEIRHCQKRLEKILIKSLTSKGKYNLGSVRGSMMESVWANTEFWYSTFEITDATQSSPRFWNGFGITKDLNQNKSNNIAVEINIPTQGLKKKVAGFFATSANSKEIFLFHRGAVGGGRAGIGKKAFLSWYPEEVLTVKDNDGNIDHGILVGEINSKSFLKDLAKFIKNTAQFREIATSGEIDQSTYLSDEELQKKAKEVSTAKKPKKKKSTTSVFERNPFIAELAKRRANGVCQLCLSQAPFLNKLGRPYLETHHIIWLSNGGEDSIKNTVALCPNCHKKIHILNLKKDNNTLNKTAKKL